MTRAFGFVMFLAGLGFAVLIGLVHTGIEAAMHRHFRRAEQLPLPPQISHVHTVPRDRQETGT